MHKNRAVCVCVLCVCVCVCVCGAPTSINAWWGCVCVCVCTPVLRGVRCARGGGGERPGFLSVHTDRCIHRPLYTFLNLCILFQMQFLFQMLLNRPLAPNIVNTVTAQMSSHQQKQKNSDARSKTRMQIDFTVLTLLY